MASGSSRDVASTRELVRFHFERASFYDALAIVLEERPDPVRLAHAESRLTTGGPHPNPHPATVELKAALAEAAATSDAVPDLASGMGEVGTRCADTESAVRAQAFVMAGVPARNERAQEIAALGKLAGRTALALGTGLVAQAGMTSDIQALLLRHHAGTCLGALARSMQGHPSKFYTRVGRALELRVADDVALLCGKDPGA